MKIKIWVFGLFVALGISVLLAGSAHAGPGYVVLSQQGDMNSSYGCTLYEELSSNAYKYRCENYGHMGGYLLVATGGLYPNTGRPYVCHFYGRNYTSGFFNQNWHHTLMISNGESSPFEACSFQKTNSNTFDAYLDLRYGKSPPPSSGGNTNPNVHSPF